METRAFQPLYGPTSGTTAGSFLASTTVSVTSSSATASTAFSGTPNSGSNQVQIANTTSAWIYVNFGSLGFGVTAATVAASYPVAPGGVVVVSVADEVNACSIIAGSSPSGSTNVILTVGEGL